MRLEKSQLDLGFIPLNDAAPLIIAKECGFFSLWGLDVTLHKLFSWSEIQQQVESKRLDAAHMLAPIPLAASLGLESAPCNIMTPLVLSLNGNGITISESLHKEILETNRISSIRLPMAAYLLQEVIARRLAEKLPKLTFATVHPYSCHHYQLRDWLYSAGISGDEIEVSVVSPVDMLSRLEQGDVDGYCVGSPWNAPAVQHGLGLTAFTSCDIWQDAPEKVLGMLSSFYQRFPNTTLAVCAALKQACMWLELPGNRARAAKILCEKAYLDSHVEVIAPPLLGACLTHRDKPPRQIPNYHLFSSTAGRSVNRPEKARAEWLLKQMAMAGQLDIKNIDSDFIESVYREDIYVAMRQRLQKLGFGPMTSSNQHFVGAPLHLVES